MIREQCSPRRPLSLYLVMCFFVLSAYGCGSGGGGDTATGGGGGGTPTTQTPSISAQGVLDFGTTVIPNTSSRLLTITNSGTANLSIGQIALQQAGTPFAIAADSCSNTSIPAAGTCQVSLQLVTNAGSVQGVFSNTLSIPSNDTAKNPLTLPLTGQIRKYFVSINEILTSDCPASKLKLFVSVIDSAGLAVPVLQGIKLFENGNPASSPIVSADNSNLTVALLLDYSSSIKDLDLIENAAKVFVDELKPTDKAAVLKFAKVRQPPSFAFTDNKTDLKALIDAPFTGDRAAGTVLYDVVYDAVGAVNNAQSIPRRAVVVLSDGLDVGSTRTLDQAIDRAVQTGIPVFAIAITDAVDPRPAVMKRLADETGGVYFEASSATEVEDIYLQIAGILSEQYSIQYTTTSSGGATIALDVEVDETADQVNEGEASRDAIGCP